MKFSSEKQIVIKYDGHPVGKHRLDIIVEGKIVLEFKAVEELGRKHYSQLRSYLRATKIRRGGKSVAMAHLPLLQG